MQTTLHSLSGRCSFLYLKKLFLPATTVVVGVLFFLGKDKPTEPKTPPETHTDFTAVVNKMYELKDRNGKRKNQTVVSDTNQLKQSDWYKSVKQDMESRSYNLATDKDAKTFSSVNHNQNLKANYNASKFSIEYLPSDAKEKKQSNNNWQLDIEVKGFYADHHLMSQPDNNSSIAIAKDNEAEYNFSNGFAVQYHNDAKGIRQNFTIKEKPLNDTRELRVSLKAEGDWVVNKVHDKELHFAKRNKKGTLDAKIVYNDLKAWDANGKILAARMEVGNDNNFEIVTNVENATYPVTIDPLSTSPSTTLSGSGSFGNSVASAGDFNGDGYTDVIVGDATDNSAFIYLGSASGLSNSAAVTLTGTGNFGFSVASAGDVDGDGFSDVIVGDPGVATGNAYVFRGSGFPYSTTAAYTLSGIGTFGASVASAGDVNGDGFSDVIVGNGIGSAFVYAGSNIGLGVIPVTLTGVGVHYGASVASAGDVNGDGFSDVVVGNAGGNAFIYQGSNLGISTSASNTLSEAGAGANYGVSVASAGDVNGDGYSEVIVGDGGGNAYLYPGSGSGLSSTAATHLTGTGSFGVTVSGAGDVNGDAYADVIVGNNNGNAYVFNGSATGAATTATTTLNNAAGNFGNSAASAGDINGDGYSDVIVGAYTGTQAFSYLGSPDVSISTGNVSIVGQNAGDRFGLSVSSAGDVNADGYDDVVVGAIGVNGITGAAYVYYGSSTGLSTGSPTILTIPFTGSSENYGWSVAGADINGDGYSDIIIGAQAQNTSTGAAYIYLGSSGGVNTSPASTLSGVNAFDEFGYSVASAGDVNGDGYSDIIVGAPNVDIIASNSGAAYLYLGSATGIATNQAADTLYGANNFEGFGISVSTAGDVNGDGYSDIIIGTSGGGGNSAFVYFGSKTGIANKQAPDVTLTGDFGNGTSGDFGISVSTAGDVNGDGYSDVIVGASSAAGSGNGGGAAAIFLGGNAGLSTTASVVLGGLAGGDQFGASVAAAGDVNGDGYGDVIVRATQATNNFPSQTGATYLYLGSPTGLNSTIAASFLDANSGASYASPEVPRRAVGGAGDVNGDGYSDLMIGVYEDPTLGVKTGKMYMYYGNNAVGHNASNVLKLYETDLVTPIAADNLTQDHFGLGLFAQSPFGSVKGRLVWETERNGIPFQGNPITNSVVLTGNQNSYASIPAGGTEFKNLIPKTGGKSTKVRVRIQYAPTAVTFGQKFSPWIYSQVYLLGGNLGVLPLDLLSFSAKTSGSDILLNWKASGENDLSTYIVEHSLDGVKFDSIGSVASKGTTGTSDYDFTHYHPSVGIHYYRLREVNKDGNKAYSKIVSAKITGSVEFSIYPNPASSHIVITHTGIASRYARIMNAAGTVVGQYKLNTNSNQTTISLNGFAKGNYFVEIMNSGFTPKQITIQ